MLFLKKPPELRPPSCFSSRSTSVPGQFLSDSCAHVWRTSGCPRNLRQSCGTSSVRRSSQSDFTRYVPRTHLRLIGLSNESVLLIAFGQNDAKASEGRRTCDPSARYEVQAHLAKQLPQRHVPPDAASRPSETQRSPREWEGPHLRKHGLQDGADARRGPQGNPHRAR